MFIDKETILPIPIVEILKSMGYNYNPITERGYYGLFLSPFRDEQTPSFKIDYDKNLWMDFGSGIGGNNIELVKQLRNISFREALVYIKNLDLRNFTPISHDRAKPIIQEQSSAINVLKVEAINRSALLSYAKERGIDSYILRKFCKQITYQVKDKTYTSIGFANRKGWVLRNKWFKGGTRSDISVINCVPPSTSLLIFEGFFDFLSFVQQQKKCYLSSDVIVLNSVSHVGRLRDYVNNYKQISVYIDNDAAGKKCFCKIQEMSQESEHPINITDYSFLYNQYNDLNESLIAKKKGLKI